MQLPHAEWALKVPCSTVHPPYTCACIAPLFQSNGLVVAENLGPPYQRTLGAWLWCLTYSV